LCFAFARHALRHDRASFFSFCLFALLTVGKSRKVCVPPARSSERTRRPCGLVFLYCTRPKGFPLRAPEGRTAEKLSPQVTDEVEKHRQPHSNSRSLHPRPSFPPHPLRSAQHLPLKGKADCLYAPPSCPTPLSHQAGMAPSDEGGLYFVQKRTPCPSCQTSCRIPRAAQSFC